MLSSGVLVHSREGMDWHDRNERWDEYYPYLLGKFARFSQVMREGPHPLPSLCSGIYLIYHHHCKWVCLRSLLEFCLLSLSLSLREGKSSFPEHVRQLQYEIDPAEVTIGEALGAGASGVVYTGKYGEFSEVSNAQISHCTEYGCWMIRKLGRCC